MEATTNPADAAETLREIGALRRRTQLDVRSYWFPLVVFGGLTLCSAPLGLVGDGTAMGIFWAFAAPAGTVAVSRYYRQRELHVGVSKVAWPYIATAVTMTVLAFVLPAVTTGHLQQVVSSFAIAGGYVVFGAIDRRIGIAALGALIAAVAAAALARGVDHPGALTAVGTGTAIVVSGLAARRAERRS
ncbi:MAG: hypothetical protein ACRDZW_01805 [Acidimicrobiales bacterium]